MMYIVRFRAINPFWCISECLSQKNNKVSNAPECITLMPVQYLQIMVVQHQIGDRCNPPESCNIKESHVLNVSNMMESVKSSKYMTCSEGEYQFDRRKLCQCFNRLNMQDERVSHQAVLLCHTNLFFIQSFMRKIYKDKSVRRKARRDQMAAVNLLFFVQQQFSRYISKLKQDQRDQSGL